MSTYTLTYFDAPVSRGEECRLALHVAGIPFVDERLTGAAWQPRKGAAPFGALPYLTVEGHAPIAQANAILRLIGSLHGLHPTDPWEAARHEALMGAIEDLRGRLTPIARITDPEEKKRAREEIASGFLQEWGASVEKQIKGPFVGGEKLNVVDIKLFVVATPFLKGAIDHVPATVFAAFPKLLQLVQSVKSHPRISDWYSRQ